MKIEFEGNTYETKASWNVLVTAYCTMFGKEKVLSQDMISWALKYGFLHEILNEK